MVLKGSKRGIHTGGTVRAHPQETRRFREPGTADAKATVTVYRPSSETKSSLNLPENFESGIQYSLNKRERWNLPSRVYEQVHRLAIDDYEAAKEESRHKKEHGRRSVALVQHPGIESSSTTVDKSNFVMYYGDRYTIPVERSSRKSKLDSMNVVLQLEEGSFFQSSKQDKEKESGKSEGGNARNRRVLRQVDRYPRRLVEETGPRSAREIAEAESEQVHVYLGDKKYVNKRQVLRQPTKPVEQHFPTGHELVRNTGKYFDSDDCGAYCSDYDDESEEESQVESTVPPAISSFKLSDFMVAAH